MIHQRTDLARRALAEGFGVSGPSLDADWARIGAAEAVLATVADLIGVTYGPELVTGRSAPFASAVASARPALAALIDEGDLGVIAALSVAGHVWNDSAPAKERRRQGAHYTPVDVADRVVALCMAQLVGDAARITDPSCGAGVFLLAAADALVRAGVAPDDAWLALHGTDLDSLAVDLARSTLALWARWRGVSTNDASELADRIAYGDGLDQCSGQWNLVVGNPPFQSQLLRRTSRGPADRVQAGRLFGAPVRYADSAALFLARAVSALAPGGVAALVVPESVLGAADAEAIRLAIAEQADLVGMWFVGGRVFGAAVRVCVPVLRRVDSELGHRPPVSPVTIWQGRAGQIVPSVESPANSRWASIAADASGIPAVEVDGAQTLGAIATVSADFRDVFYALAAAVRDFDEIERNSEADDSEGREQSTMFRVVTAGSIDPFACRWGERPTRLLRRSFSRPVVRRQDVNLPDAWFDSRMQAKVVVASQTRVLEATDDCDGRLAPVTPVLSVVPHDKADLWRVLAVLLSPVSSAIVVRGGAGTGMSGDAVRVRCADVLRLPLPTGLDAWENAAEALRGASGETDARVRRSALLAAARQMAVAYRLDDGRATAVHQWWEARLPAP